MSKMKMYTVKELKEELAKYHDEMPIQLHDLEDDSETTGTWDVFEVSEVTAYAGDEDDKEIAARYF